jgi:uncharacterized protein
VTVEDLDRVGELLGVAVNAGGPDARVEHVGLAVEAPELDDARQAAFDDARRRAEQYAALAGRSLGPLLALSELDGGPGPRPQAEAADAAGVAAPPVEPGRQQVAVVVTAT